MSHTPDQVNETLITSADVHTVSPKGIPNHIPNIILVFIGWYGSVRRQRERFLNLYQTKIGERQSPGDDAIVNGVGVKGVLPEEFNRNIFEIINETPVLKHCFYPDPFSSMLWKKIDDSCERYYSRYKDPTQPPEIVFHVMSNNGGISIINLYKYLQVNHRGTHHCMEKGNQTSDHPLSTKTTDFGDEKLKNYNTNNNNMNICSESGGLYRYTSTCHRYITSPTNPSIQQVRISGIIIDSAPGNMLVYNGWKVFAAMVPSAVRNTVICVIGVGFACALSSYLYACMCMMAWATEGTAVGHYISLTDGYRSVYCCCCCLILISTPFILLMGVWKIKRTEMHITKKYHDGFTDACVGLIRDRGDFCVYNNNTSNNNGYGNVTPGMDNDSRILYSSDMSNPKVPNKFIQFLYGKDDNIIEKEAVENVYHNICSSLQKTTKAPNDYCRDNNNIFNNCVSANEAPSLSSQYIGIGSIVLSAHCFTASRHVAHYKTFPNIYSSLITAAFRVLKR